MANNNTNIAISTKFFRYEKVMAVLIKYGFEDIVSHPPFDRIIPQSGKVVPSRNGKKVTEYTRYERIRMVCEELGTTYIKFAQIASNRPDLLPEELVDELSKLQDQAPKIPTKEVKKLVKERLPRPVKELLEYFDEKPLATASMAQVHRARLLGGKEVILKIQRPNIRANIFADISIMKSLVAAIEKRLPKYKVYNLGELIKMFEKSISEELDFTLEARNQVEFARMFANNEAVFVPKIYKELCSEKIICMEYVDGYKVTDLENLKKLDISGKYLAETGINLYFDQVFNHGFFHADPHPGNIFVLPDKRIVFLDFGMMGTIIESDKIQFSNILLALYEQDVQGLKKAVLKYAGDLDEDKKRELEYDIIHIIRNYSNVSIENIDGNEVMKGLNAMFFDYKIRLPANLLLLIKALVVIEGVGLKLYPEYNIIQNIGPFVSKLLRKKYNVKSLRKDIMHGIDEVNYFVKEMPEDIREVIQKIKNGKIHVEFEHKGLEETNANLDVIANRLSFTMLIVALIIASSIIILADISPKFYDIPILAIVGLGIAGFLGIRLFYAILKHGKI